MDAAAGATLERISDIIARVTAGIDGASARAGATTQYVYNPYEANINPGTPNGLNTYLKLVKAKVKDKDRIKISSKTWKRW